MNVHKLRNLSLAGLCFPAMFFQMPPLLASSNTSFLIEQKAPNDNIVKGVVLDQDGLPIIGANVVVKGTTNGVITDLDGCFSLDLNLGAVLQISYIGYVTQEIMVKDNNTLTITLKEDTETLDEVVVVGYGTMKKSDLTGAVSKITSDDLGKLANVDATQALQGKIAGVNIQLI